MTAAIELECVHKSFGKTKIIDDVSLTIHTGEKHVMIGPNGAGKSTLFNLISGLFPPSSGRILLKGEDTTGLKPNEINRRGLSRSFQVTNIFPRMTVFQNVRCAVLWALGYRYAFWGNVNRPGEISDRVSDVLTRVKLQERSGSLASELSYTDQRALEIAVTIAGGADVVLLDEPTSGMSRNEIEHIVALIDEIAKDRTLVIIEHDMNVVFDVADRISVLVYGCILATGAPEEVRANRDVQEAYLGKEIA